MEISLCYVAFQSVNIQNNYSKPGITLYLTFGVIPSCVHGHHINYQKL